MLSVSYLAFYIMLIGEFLHIFLVMSFCSSSSNHNNLGDNNVRVIASYTYPVEIIQVTYGEI